jgi:hypothetical protein
VIYNLAFSPKIRVLDLNGMQGTNSNTVEALYKLLNISGSIEHLDISESQVLSQIASLEFMKSIG